MQKRITQDMVLLYVTDHLSENDRRLVEEAFQTNLQVQSWFARLGAEPKGLADLAGTPADDGCLAGDSVPDSLAQYLNERWDRLEQMAREGVAPTWDQGPDAEQLTALVACFHQKQPKLDEAVLLLPAKEMLFGPGGTLAYRDEVPIAAGNRTRSMKPVEIPCIQPDFGDQLLIIRQWASELPSPVVEVYAAKLVRPELAELSHPKRIELLAGRHPDGREYWHEEIALQLLLPNLQEGDDVVFYVEPVVGEENVTPAQ